MDLKDIADIGMLGQFLGVACDPLVNRSMTGQAAVTANIMEARGFSNFLARENNLMCRRMKIPKKNRSLGYRIVYQADPLLSTIHKALDWYLNIIYKPNDCVHGFVKTRGIKSNARAHLAKKKILNIDINDFFGSIGLSKIQTTFMELGCKTEIAQALAKLTTLNGTLVQGFATSPMLANMVCSQLDKDLLKIADEYNCTYTRYADDICYSTNEDLPAITVIEEVLRLHGFSINPKKFQIMFRGHKQFVTGLTVFDHEYPRVPRRMKRNLRLEIYYIKKFGVIRHLFRKWGLKNGEEPSNKQIENIKSVIFSCACRIKGYIDYINSIEPRAARKLWDEFKKTQIASIPESHSSLDYLSEKLQKIASGT